MAQNKTNVFLEISLLCNFILGLFYQAPQTGFFLTGGIKLLVGSNNVGFGIEIVSIGLWLFFIYLIVEKWNIPPSDLHNIREFILQAIIPVAIGCILGALDIALTNGAQYATRTMFGMELTTNVNSFGTFLKNFFSVEMLMLVVFNTAMILLMYITLYNHKLNRDIELEQNQPLPKSPKINHL